MPIPRRSRQGQRPYLHVWCGLFLAYMRQYFQLAWGEVKYMCPVAPVPIYTAMLLEQPADFVSNLKRPQRNAVTSPSREPTLAGRVSSSIALAGRGGSTAPASCGMSPGSERASSCSSAAECCVLAGGTLSRRATLVDATEFWVLAEGSSCPLAFFVTSVR